MFSQGESLCRWEVEFCFKGEVQLLLNTMGKLAIQGCTLSWYEFLSSERERFSLCDWTCVSQIAWKWAVYNECYIFR